MRGWIQTVVRWNGVVVGVAIALTLAGTRLVGGNVDPELLALVAFGSFAVYGLDRRAFFAPEDQTRRQVLSPLPAWAPWGSLLIVLLLTWRREVPGQIILCGLGLLCALYVLPLLPGRRRLKEVPYAKTLLVGAGWAIATVLLPAVGEGSLPMAEAWLLAGYRCLFLLPNLLLADWPDRDADLAAGILTVANQTSPVRFRCITAMVCLAAIGGAIWISSLGSNWVIWEVLTPIAFLILLTQKLPQSRMFYAVIADSLIAWPVIPALWAG